MIGEAIAAEEEVSERTGGMLKGNEGRMVEAVIVTEEECQEDRTTPRCQTKPTHLTSLTSGGIGAIMNGSPAPGSNPSCSTERRNPYSTERRNPYRMDFCQSIPLSSMCPRLSGPPP